MFFFALLFVWLIDLFIDRLIGLLIYWLIDWLIDWLFYWLFYWLIYWMIDWLIDWSIDWLIVLLIDLLIDLLNDWLIDWLIDRLLFLLGQLQPDWLLPRQIFGRDAAALDSSHCRRQSGRAGSHGHPERLDGFGIYLKMKRRLEIIIKILPCPTLTHSHLIPSNFPSPPHKLQALSGDASVVSLFELWRSAYKGHEQDPVVWQNILTHVGRLSALLAYTDAYKQYQQYAQELLLPVLKSVGWSTKEGQGDLPHKNEIGPTFDFPQNHCVW